MIILPDDFHLDKKPWNLSKSESSILPWSPRWARWAPGEGPGIPGPLQPGLQGAAGDLRAPPVAW